MVRVARIERGRSDRPGVPTLGSGATAGAAGRACGHAGWRAVQCMGVALALLLACGVRPAFAADPSETEIALTLADMLRAARTVISENQSLINDASKGEKGLTGAVVLAKASAKFRAASGKNPSAFSMQTREGRLLHALMDSIAEVVDEHQGTINRQGIGFKGFVPAVFARLVNERFAEKVGHEAEIKVTAPQALVRNRKALPDSWEREVIQTKLLSAHWPRGQLYEAEAMNKGRRAYRIMVPEYYTGGCLSCHGEPKGAIDITGYPKEGGKLGELGGAISITLYR